MFFSLCANERFHINDDDNKEDKIALLLDAGMNRVRMGIQSGSENILEFYKRPTKLNRIKESTKILNRVKPDLIVVHGDRVEALAGSIVGSLNNILVSHIEGGEVSGTIDDTIRHAVTKLSHIHFVGSSAAKNRIIKMGEIKKHIFN